MTDITDDKVKDKSEEKQKANKAQLEARVLKLEKDLSQVIAMLHKMKTAIGLPDSLIPDMDD